MFYQISLFILDSCLLLILAVYAWNFALLSDCESSDRLSWSRLSCRVLGALFFGQLVMAIVNWVGKDSTPSMDLGDYVLGHVVFGGVQLVTAITGSVAYSAGNYLWCRRVRRRSVCNEAAKAKLNE